jgi:hypothetical protein
MQNKHEGIIRAINSGSNGFNILTAPTHEAYQTNMGQLPHTFYMYQAGGFKKWSFGYRQLPKNHILLDGTQAQVKLDMKFDVVLSQNKFGQFQTFDEVSKYIDIPLVSIEHTLPVPSWGKRQMEAVKSMRGNINVFISEFSVDKWGFSLDDPTVRIIHHGINTETFKPNYEFEGDGKVLTVVNDWINRDWCCGWNIYKNVVKELPINPVGDTPGFSKPASNIDDLVVKYQNASVFLNTSTISPVPTSLLEAMSCGCPVVTTATCMIPEIVEDGVNGFCSNDESYLTDRLMWCLQNPDEAKVIGRRARDTILNKFSIKNHLQKWQNVFKEVYGRGRTW